MTQKWQMGHRLLTTMLFQNRVTFVLRDVSQNDSCSHHSLSLYGKMYVSLDIGYLIVKKVRCVTNIIRVSKLYIFSLFLNCPFELGAFVSTVVVYSPNSSCHV